MQDAKAGTTLEQAKAAWNEFVASVERGDAVDASGQYVKKSTWGVADDGARVMRLKQNAENKSMKMAKNGDVTTYYIQPICDDPNNPDCSGPGGGGPTPTTPVTFIFRGSEGIAPYNGPDNPAGYIYDLKIVKGSSSNQTPLDGYTIIPVDLNKGAGGQYIYVTFTRNPSKVQYGRETDPDNAAGRTINGPVRSIYSTANNTGAEFQSWPGTSVPIWAPGAISGTWKQPDLNDGAGGRFIASYQNKDPRVGNPVEVGIIAGNSRTITPPAGWTKLDASNSNNVDLNEGAGGDYIYYCIKRR